MPPRAKPLLDIIAVPWGSSSDNLVHILLNDTHGSFTLSEETLNHYGYDDLKLADLNGDGINDMLVVSGQGTTVLSRATKRP